MPVSHVSDMTKDRVLLTYALMRGMTINAGSWIKENIEFIENGHTTGGLGHGSVITMLCYKAGVLEFVTDIYQPLQQPLSISLMKDYHEPALYVPQTRKKGKRRVETEVEEEADPVM